MVEPVTLKPEILRAPEAASARSRASAAPPPPRFVCRLIRRPPPSRPADGVNAFALTPASVFSCSREKPIMIKQWDLNGFQATRSRMAAHAD
eukprot:tig00020564_g11444.t1